jgi:hypothetical protein
MNDDLYLKLCFRFEMGSGLNYSCCETMNEKLQWLKLNNRRAEMTDIVDKINVKSYIAHKIGQEYIVPTLKVWNNPDEITEEEIRQLPNSFVIKTNHSGGNTGVYICKDKKALNLDTVRFKMSKSLKSDIYARYREWPYKNVQKRIFAEEYLGADLVDYKFNCFNGDVDSVMLCIGRQESGGTKFYFFDKDWNLRRYNKAGKAAPEGFTLPKPEGMDKMFEIASKLSIGFPFVRVDLYNIKGRIYFGELTFYPASGFDSNLLPETDLYFGNKIDLSLVRN